MKRIVSVLIVLATLGIAYSESAEAARCGSRGCYRNRPEGHLVPRPNGDPQGATALCANGRFSHSQHPYAPGTCSRNGGVKRYIGSADGASQTQRQGGVPATTPLRSNLCPPPYRMTERDGCQ
jgi:hypothetical protein